jgi:hypothetical protein
MVWPCFLFTVRMTNAPLLLLTVIAGIGYFAYRKRFPWPCLFLAAFFVIPFLFRNFLLSGYPLFPLYQFDFFKADWKADKSEMIQIGEFIKYYNRSGGDPERVRHLSFPYWLAEWFRQLYTYNKVLIVLSLLCWTWMALHWKKWTDRRPTVVKGMVLTLAGSILCWFITGPDPRFNYGALLAGPFLIILLYPRHPFFSLTSKVLLPTGRARGIFMVCLTLCIFTYSIIKILTIPAYRNLTTPRSLPLPAYRELTIDGIAVRIPEKILDNWNPRCYDLALPCLYRVNPRLRSRGRNIRDGFRLDGPARGMNPRLPIGPDNPAEDDGEFKLE